MEGDKARVRTLEGELVEVAIRTLNPGFALTYHRLQGQTFECPLYVSLRRLFDRSMLYVAVTRVTTFANLRLVGSLTIPKKKSAETQEIYVAVEE
jgi:ATP-dependent exoDNAse (exonuclease V) alpha subunit